MNDSDKKILLLIKYLDIQLLRRKADLDKLGTLSEYGTGCLDMLETIMIAALSIKNEFNDDASESAQLKLALNDE